MLQARLANEEAGLKSSHVTRAFAGVPGYGFGPSLHPQGFSTPEIVHLAGAVMQGMAGQTRAAALRVLL